ncbi:MAG: DsbA family protein [Chloroflexota bacterium]
MSSPVRPYLIQLVLSQRLLEWRRNRAELSRIRNGQPHLVTVYLAIDDPHSYLLLQVLGDLRDRFDIEFEFRSVLNKQTDMFPAPGLWDKNAFNDGEWLAQLYGLKFPVERPNRSAEENFEFTARLIEWEKRPDFIQNALILFAGYWNEDKAVAFSSAKDQTKYQDRLFANERRLKVEGHYLSGMLHYGGEWYWGLNRLQYLERRFLKLGVNTEFDTVAQFDLGQQSFCKRMSKEQIRDALRKPTNQNFDRTPLELFWSIRSPYSYVGIVRGRKLAEHYQVPVTVKPVLPMVMRGMQVPQTKSRYIARDAKREADQVGIPFGRIADPLGKGVERCYALVEYAQSQDKLHDFLESYARGVWSEGIRSDTDTGLQILVERVGLSWEEARPLLADESWREGAQANQDELFSHGLWGVPSFVYGETKVFGQDRLDRIEDAIVNNLRQ